MTRATVLVRMPVLVKNMVGGKREVCKGCAAPTEEKFQGHFRA